MTNKEKQLLLKDLCARLPYGVKFKANNEEYIREIHYIKDENVYIREYRNLPYWIDTIKPYLRPMESMTDEEIDEFILISDTVLWLGDKRSTCILSLEQMDWLNARHFDYRGLIPMGLALEAKKGMYNN